MGRKLKMFDTISSATISDFEDSTFSINSISSRVLSIRDFNFTSTTPQFPIHSLNATREPYESQNNAGSSWTFTRVTKDIAKQLLNSNYPLILPFKHLDYDDTESYFWCYRSDNGSTQQYFIALDNETCMIKALRLTSYIPKDAIRELCYRLSCAANNHLHLQDLSPTNKIKRICFVGGIDCDFISDSHDATRLQNTIQYCLKSGIFIDPDFTVDVVNLSDGRDFLKEEHRYDMVILGYIFRFEGNSTSETLAKDQYSGASTINSEIHSITKWIERIESCSAKIIVSYGGIKSELTVNVLRESPSISVLMPATDILSPEYNSGGLDMPFMSAFAMNNSYLNLMQKVLGKMRKPYNTALANSVLGRDLHSVERQTSSSSTSDNFCGLRSGFLS